jgi:regulator of sigma E protease
VNITVAILGLALLILVHEAGHFFVSLAVGMRPRKFYVGFPPALVKVRRNGIEYGIGAIPLGGFVKIPGMHRPAPSDVDAHFGRAIQEQSELGPTATALKRRLEAGEMEEARDVLPRFEGAVAEAELTPAARRGADRGLTEIRDALGQDAYWRQPTWKRVAAILAGPATNLVFAIALLAVIFMLGIPTAATSRVEAVLDDSPAARAGLQAGDEIVAVNAKPASGAGISQRIRAAKGAPVRLTVVRDERRVELPAVKPQVIEGAARLGFVLAAEYERSNPLEATELATRVVWEVTKAIGVSLADLVTGENRKDVASAVGIVQGSSQALESGIRDYLEVLALISLSLALLNLLPLLPLDGGHITFAVIEGIRGRSVGREVYERASVVGIVLVLFLFMIGLSNDIDRIQGDS